MIKTKLTRWNGQTNIDKWIQNIEYNLQNIISKSVSGFIVPSLKSTVNFYIYCLIKRELWDTAGPNDHNYGKALRFIRMSDCFHNRHDNAPVTIYYLLF